MFGISKYIIMGLVIALALAGGVIWWLKKENETLLKNVATLQANMVTAQSVNKSLNEEIDRIVDLQREQQEQLGALNETINKVTIEKNDAVAKLNGYRNRISDLAQKKPGLIGRFATRATNNVLRDFVCASGDKDKSYCSKAVPPANAGTDRGTAKDKVGGTDTNSNRPEE
jgi:hypothetical protein